MENCTLLEWLNSEPLPEDIMPLPWDLSVSYIPIEVVRRKIEIMETQFGAIVTQTDVNVSAINTQTKEKDTCFMATVKFVIEHEEFKGSKTIVGAASFLAGQYSGGWAFAQIAEALASTRAFSKQWKQFGKGLNDKEDAVKNMKAPANGTAKETSSNVKDTLKTALK